MLIEELIAESLKMVDQEGNTLEIFPSGNGGYTAYKGTQEHFFPDSKSLGEFLSKYNFVPVQSSEKKNLVDWLSEELEKIEEKNKHNAWVLTGSGRADPQGKKGGSDSPEHRKVRTPGTTYSKTRKKHNHGAKPGARDGFVG